MAMRLTQGQFSFLPDLTDGLDPLTPTLSLWERGRLCR